MSIIDITPEDKQWLTINGKHGRFAGWYGNKGVDLWYIEGHNKSTKIEGLLPRTAPKAIETYLLYGILPECAKWDNLIKWHTHRDGVPFCSVDFEKVRTAFKQLDERVNNG